MSILTSTAKADFDTASMLTREFEIRYGTVIPLLICAASFGNSLIDAYAETMGEEPETILQSLALDMLMKGENPNAH
jgi:hypothetical protein